MAQQKSSLKKTTRQSNPLAHQEIARELLRWYDANARDLPWRIGPAARKAGEKPDPYHVWLSEIMLQQTTVATVKVRYQEFLARWPTVNDMAASTIEDVLGQWAGLGYYARARNLHKCASIVSSEHGGKFPDTENALRALPGIGDYTAAAIAAIAFDKPAIVVDSNIERVVSRLFAVEAPLPAAKPQIKARAGEIWPQKRAGDFAQGLMDLGSAICKPKAPLCLLCPISSACKALTLGRAEEFPHKAAKKARPTRTGAVFAMVNMKGEMLFERRPPNGLLGGMLGLPGTAWQIEPHQEVKAAAPAGLNWQDSGAITHTFTHFHLVLDVYTANAPKGFRRNDNQQWISPDVVRLPTVMKKAVELITKNKGAAS